MVLFESKISSIRISNSPDIANVYNVYPYFFNKPIENKKIMLADGASSNNIRKCENHLSVMKIKGTMN